MYTNTKTGQCNLHLRSNSWSNFFPELQIRGGIEDNSKLIFSYFFMKTLCCDSSLEPSLPEGFNGESQSMFLSKNMANYPCYPFLSGSLYFFSELICLEELCPPGKEMML